MWFISFSPRAAHLAVWAPLDGTKDENSHSHQLTTGERFWGSVGSLIVRNHTLVAFGCLVFIAISAWGLTNTRSNIELLKLFDSSARILKDYAWLEDNLGKLVPLEIVVRFDSEIQSNEPDKTPKLKPMHFA